MAETKTTEATLIKQLTNTCNGSLGSSCKYYLDVTLNSQDIENNTSNITLHAYAQATSTSVGSYNLYGTAPSKIGYKTSSSGDYTYVVNRTQNMDFRNKALVDLGSWSGDIKHNSNGSLTLYLDASFSTDGPSAVTGGSISGSTTVTTIPRESTFTATDADIESNTTLSITCYSSSFTHTLSYTFGSLSGNFFTGKTLSVGTNSISQTIPSDFYKQIPNDPSGTCTLTLTTYNGSAKIDSDTKKIKVTANKTKCIPTITGTVVDTNDETIALTGDSSKLIKYKSTALITATATAKNSATIKSILIDNQASPLTVTNVSKNNFALTCADSRNYPGSGIASASSMVEYVPLTCKAEFTRRVQTGSEVLLSYNGNYFNDNFGTSDNELSASWAYREKGATSWTMGGELSPTISGNTYSGDISCGNIYDYKKSYEFIVYVTDKLSSLNSGVILVKQGIPNFAIFEKCIMANGEVIRSW